MSLKNALKRLLPKGIRKVIGILYHLPRRKKEQRLISSIHIKHAQALARVRGKKKIRIVFFVIHASVWKYGLLYKLLEEDERFDPLIVICPYVTYGRRTMLEEMRTAFEAFKESGYQVFSTYKEETEEWIDVKKTINPDVVFFTNPHRLTRDEYYIENWQNTLTCYVPYAYVIIHILDAHYNKLFHHLLWRHFCETPIHRKYALSFAKRTPNNIRVSGFPGLDQMLLKDFKPKEVWKLKTPGTKRIIWAPHHTIDENKEHLSYSNFLEYAEFMLEFTKKNREIIQVAFKPHPILKPRLYQHPDWGVERTNAYYRAWENLSNGQLEEGDYIDLFASSDAMLMDSASFMVEYLYTGKPIMFMMRDESVSDRFNSFGKQVFSQLYQSRCREDVIEFLEKVVILGQDTKKDGRTQFFTQAILPSGGKTASENIYNELINELC